MKKMALAGQRYGQKKGLIISPESKAMSIKNVSARSGWEIMINIERELVGARP